MEIHTASSIYHQAEALKLLDIKHTVSKKPQWRQTYEWSIELNEEH